MTMARRKKLGPAGYDLSSVHDALQLGSRCGVEFTPAEEEASPPSASDSLDDQCSPGQCLFVDATSGSDSNAGSLAAPLRTIASAVVKSRSTASQYSNRSIFLRAGTHWLSESLVLGPRDSGLTLSGYKEEDATVSGGVPLTGLKWRSHDSSNGRNIWVADLSGLSLDEIPGLRLDGERVSVPCYPLHHTHARVVYTRVSYREGRVYRSSARATQMATPSARASTPPPAAGTLGP
jgi:hypothetical protein